MTGVEPIHRDQTGGILPCELPYIAIWHYGEGGDDLYGMRGCIEHSRTYRRIAECVKDFGWRQVTGPTDY